MDDRSELDPRLEDALREVIDPELGINVVDLGLVYRAALEGDAAHVEMTMTTPACPLGPHIVESAENAIRRHLPAVRSVTVDLVWDPPWSPERMSAATRRSFGL